MKFLLATAALAAALVGTATAQGTSAWGVDGPIRFANIPEFNVAAIDTKAGLPIIMDVYGLTATRDGKLNGFADIAVEEVSFDDEGEAIVVLRYSRRAVPVSGVYKVSIKDTSRYVNRPGGDSSTRAVTSTVASAFSFAFRARGADCDVAVSGNFKDTSTFGFAGFTFASGMLSGNDGETVRVVAKAGAYRATGLDTIDEDVFSYAQNATLRTTTASFPSELGTARSFKVDAAVWDEGVSSSDDEETEFTPVPFADGAGGNTVISGQLYTEGRRAPGFLTIAQTSNANYGIRTAVRVFTTATEAYVDELLADTAFTYINVVGDDDDPELDEELLTSTSWNARGAFLITSTTTWDSGTLDEYTGFEAP